MTNGEAEYTGPNIITPHEPRDRSHDEQFEQLPDHIDLSDYFPGTRHWPRTSTQWKNEMMRRETFDTQGNDHAEEAWQRMRMINEDYSDLDLINDSPALALALGFKMSELMDLGVRWDHPHFAGPRRAAMLEARY